MTRRIIRKFRTREAMARFAVGLFKKALRGKNPGPLLTALSGGKTPVPFLKILSGLKIDWRRAHFFMADERLVPLSSRGSNFGQARRLLFSKIKIPPVNLHPVKVSRPASAAGAYGKELRKHAGASGGLDIVFLGLGEDGHTASLFPGSPALAERKKLVSPVRAPADVKPEARITLTLKVLNSAGTIVLMASGPSKKTAFIQTAACNKKMPAARLSPRGRLYLLFSKQ